MAALQTWLSAGSLEFSLVSLAGLAWLGAALATLVLGADSRALLRQIAPQERNRWALAVLLALVLRLLTPFDWVRVFTGWDLLGRVASGHALPKYGAGFIGLLRPLNAALGPALEAWISGLNVGFGVATVGGLGLLTYAWLPRRNVLPAVSLVLAVLPVLIRHHRSETAFVAAFAAWLVGAACWARWLRSGRVGYAWLAIAPLAAAAYTRPAFVLAAPVSIWALQRWLPRQPAVLAGAAMEVAAGRKTSPRRGRAPLIALLWLLLPHILWLAMAAVARGGRGDLPASASWRFILQWPVMLVGMNLWLWPHAFPFGLTALGLWSAWRAHGRRDAAALALTKTTFVVGVALISLGMADPVQVSMPRLQAPWLTLWAAVATALLVSQWPPAHANHAGKFSARAAVAVVAVLISMLATVPWLFQPENADHEARALSRAATLLAGKSGTLYWLGYGDLGGDKVSRHYPRWRFERPRAQLLLRPLRDVPPLRPGHSAGVRWVYLGVRCFARHRRRDEAAPARFEQPACAAIRRRPDLRPLFEVEVPNHGDVHFPWWPRQPTLRIGLYELSG